MKLHQEIFKLLENPDLSDNKHLCLEFMDNRHDWVIFSQMNKHHRDNQFWG